MKKKLAIIGSGHLGQQLAHYALSDGHYKEVCFFDDFVSEGIVNGHRLLGNSECVEREFKKKSFDEILIGIGYKHIEKRKYFFEKFSHIIPFGQIIHSSSWIDPSARVGRGCVIYPSCSIDMNVIVHENSIMNAACTIAHDSVVAKHCFLAPTVAIAGFVNIGEQCIIGINSTIIDNINIVSKTQLGGGTVVIGNIEKEGLYVGNPSRFVR